MDWLKFVQVEVGGVLQFTVVCICMYTEECGYTLLGSVAAERQRRTEECGYIFLGSVAAERQRRTEECGYMFLGFVDAERQRPTEQCGYIFLCSVAAERQCRTEECGVEARSSHKGPLDVGAEVTDLRRPRPRLQQHRHTGRTGDGRSGEATTGTVE